MNLHDYQGLIEGFAAYPSERAERYCKLGLFGEAGEISNQVKKIWRDDHGALSFDRRDKLRDELGDVLWYAVRLAHHWELVVGTFTVEIGAASGLADFATVGDIFSATERLNAVVGGICLFVLPDDDKEPVIQELLNTIADVANQLGTSIEDVAQANVDKLQGRIERGTLQGSGDGR